MEAGGKGSPSGAATDSSLAAKAAAPLAAAPEQALKAEASEAASEPELLFAPDFIISQVLWPCTPFIFLQMVVPTQQRHL